MDEIPVMGIRESANATTGLGPHRHPGCLEICHLHRGELMFHAAGQDYHLHGNEAFINFPGELHGNGRHPYGKSLLYWMQIRLDPAPRSLLGMSETLTRDTLPRLLDLPARHFSVRPGTAHHFERAWSRLDHPIDALNKLHITTHLLQWVLEIIEASHDAKGPRHSQDMAQIIGWIEANPEANPLVDELAAMVNLSPSRFKAKFKQQVGLPPREFLMRAKVREAQARIRARNCNITTLAHELGFSSSQYFATAFRRFTSQSPSEYLRHVATIRDEDETA